MPHPRYSAEEIARRGHELYEKRIRAKVEIPENMGKAIIIDIETGAYEIDDKHWVAAERLLAKRPEAPLFAMRIGRRALIRIHGNLVTLAVVDGGRVIIERI